MQLQLTPPKTSEWIFTQTDMLFTRRQKYGNL